MGVLWKIGRQDGNVGLIRQVVDALTRSQIRKLTQTYLTMNLEQVFALSAACCGSSIMYSAQ